MILVWDPNLRGRVLLHLSEATTHLGVTGELEEGLKEIRLKFHVHRSTAIFVYNL